MASAPEKSLIIIVSFCLSWRSQASATTQWPYLAIFLALCMMISMVTIKTGSWRLNLISSNYLLFQQESQTFDILTTPSHWQGVACIAAKRLTGKIFDIAYCICLAAAIALRAWSLSVAFSHRGCTTWPIEAALPILLITTAYALYWRGTSTSLHEEELENDVAKSSGDVWFKNARGKPTCSQCLITLLMTFAIFLQARSQIASSHVCFGTDKTAVLRLGSLFVDAFIVNCAYLRSGDGNNAKKQLMFLIPSLFGIVVFLLISAVRNVGAQFWMRVLITDHASTTLADASLISMLLWSSGSLASSMPFHRIAAYVMLAIASQQQFHVAYSRGLGSSTLPTQTSQLAILCLVCGLIMIVLDDIQSRSRKGLISGFVDRQNWIYSAIFMLLGYVALSALLSSRTQPILTHPITTLMARAQIQSSSWKSQAYSSTSLVEAVEHYNMRYSRAPPINFDKWYEYALAHKSLIIDDYDQIWRDLAPFASLAPSYLRSRISEINSDRNTNIGGIRIVNGTAEVDSFVPGTHRWMLDGVVDMINKFSRYLPDMELSFNLDDECRVAVPYFNMQTAISSPNTIGTRIVQRYNTEMRNDSYIIEESDSSINGSDLFLNEQFRPSYYSRGAAHCVPDSAAKIASFHDPAYLCQDCGASFTYHQFIANWTQSADICSQPDLSNLHGFFLSPSTLLISSKLLPIFSQSKVSGFNDILFPSPWNYMDKVRHDPASDTSFAEKQNSLFWRGATSEGMAIEDSWRGMQRQRFVNLANIMAKSTATVPVLLPVTSSTAESYRYQHSSMPGLNASLNTHIDAAIVPPISRCEATSCAVQQQILRTAPAVSFQSHWSYKYLLDLDGAGFSGRFLPFLRSNSVPVKAALFREWYDDRLIPWFHFIPLDARFSGLWDILAYFGGWKGALGREVEAQFIAEKGKEFATTMLRKEDMEIYMFRLLLEFGRLCDDHRDESGFVL